MKEAKCVYMVVTCVLFLLYRMEYYKFALLVVFLSYIERCWSSSCVVDSFTVKQDFDPKKVSLENMKEGRIMSEHLNCTLLG